ncbi:MAG: SRPBCC family protein [Saprospiraceae bacterium]|nr:SRPBCC family protein [Saprospiraceae bacterium]
MSLYQFFQEQKLNTTIEEAWDFISAPKNLQKITPDYMGFNIVTPNLPNKIYEGMLIQYKVRPLLGLKMNWLTEITQVKELKFFVDEQRIGPYSIWHHQHFLEPLDQGVLMKDIVSYVPPFGYLGDIANTLFIRRKLDSIFKYRKEVLEKLFN